MQYNIWACFVKIKVLFPHLDMYLVYGTSSIVLLTTWNSMGHVVHFMPATFTFQNTFLYPIQTWSTWKLINVPKTLPIQWRFEHNTTELEDVSAGHCTAAVARYPVDTPIFPLCVVST